MFGVPSQVVLQELLVVAYAAHHSTYLKHIIIPV